VGVTEVGGAIELGEDAVRVQYLEIAASVKHVLVQGKARSGEE